MIKYVGRNHNPSLLTLKVSITTNIVRLKPSNEMFHKSLRRTLDRDQTALVGAL